MCVLKAVHRIPDAVRRMRTSFGGLKKPTQLFTKPLKRIKVQCTPIPTAAIIHLAHFGLRAVIIKMYMRFITFEPEVF